MKINAPNNPEDQQRADLNTDRTPRREGGEDSVENIPPDDSRADEKVVVNMQQAHKVVNIPSPSAPKFR
ncbi:MAG: hypothetical protein C4329_00660 [Chitinophagaceae bacterium]